jgi:dCTP deaminase
MILSDHDIKNRLGQRYDDEKEHYIISPFNMARLTPNGYDLSLDVSELSKDHIEQRVSKDNVKYNAYILKANELLVFKGKETLDVPNGVVGIMFLRSRYARQGVTLNVGVIDAGFNGKIIASMKNNSKLDIPINLDEGVVQILFMGASHSDNPYGTQSKDHFQKQGL